MKKMFLIFAFIIAGNALLAQSTWTNDKMHSQLKFAIVHLGVNDIGGNFRDFDVSITAARNDFSDAKFILSAKTASVFTGAAPRDSDLRSAEFFDVNRLPEMTFVSTSLRKTASGKYKINGKLTLHGITKTVTMDLWYRGTINNPISKKLDAGFQLTGSIKRSDFNFGSKYPAPMLSDIVRITADGEFNKTN